jgi:hypothetical protein
MQIPANEAKTKPRASGWSNRILLAAIAGILFLTLYPFKFSLHPHLPLKSTPFLLGSGLKGTSAPNFSLNVLLFVPLGFGLSSKLRQRHWSWTTSLVVTTLAGFVISYLIEFAQIYVPLRDSGWEDVISNSAGAFLGALLFAGIGRLILRPLAEGERRLESWLTPLRSWLLLIAYFAAWVFVSIPLQRQTSLKYWNPNSYLLVGIDSSLYNRWKGKLLRIQIWDHAIPDSLAQEISARGAADVPNPTPLADYDFSLPPPIHDQQRFLPDLTWSSHRIPDKSEGHLEQVSNSWMVSQATVPNLISALENTNQFTVRLVCLPPKDAGPEGAITSIAPIAGRENLSIWQQGGNLMFYFRSKATTKTWSSWNMGWPVSGVFLAGQMHDIFITYDGSNLSFFVDRKKDRHTYQLGPGLGLANLFHRAKPGEVQIYNDLYYLAVFFPGGCLIGICSRRFTARQFVGPFLFSVFVAPFVLEKILVCASGRSLSYSDLTLSCVLVAVAAFWINADRSPVDTD